MEVEKHVKRIVTKFFPYSGRKLVQNFRFYRTADTPHFNYKRKPTAVLVQGVNSGLFYRQGAEAGIWE